MKLVKEPKHTIRESLILNLIEESFSEKINNLKKPILLLIAFSFLFSLGYSIDKNNLYFSLVELFSILSTVYAILIGFNISAVVFIVSYLFKESFNLDQRDKKLDQHDKQLDQHDKQKLRGLYKQIVNSFMLSTFNNLTIIILGLYHLIVVKVFNLLIGSITIPFFINKILNILYLNIWLFLILSSVIVFIRCLIILTRLLRLSEHNI